MDQPLMDIELMTKKASYTVDDVAALPEDRRVQLIDGVLYDMATPSTEHQAILGGLYYEIVDYIKKNGGKCRVFPAPFAVYLENDKRNWFEPDITIVCDPDKLTERGCNGAPDMIIEIVSKSTEKNDYMRKFSKYYEMGVREYWIIDPTRKRTATYWFEKDNGDDELEINPPESAVGNYDFDEEVPFYIYPELKVRIADYLG